MARRAEPASVAIDVEACVRLLGIAADRHERHARRLERSGYIGEGPDGERSNAVQLRALASALPGMGKDSEALAALRKALPNIAKDSERWRYVRDVSWHDVKRSELPGDLMDAVYRLDECTSSIKYPTAEHLDAAVDNLNAARAAQPEETP